jgi:hypothetical protein
MRYQSIRSSVELGSRHSVFAFAIALSVVFARAAAAQESSRCSTDRAVSTLVGAGLGIAAGAIPATVVHRHDQTSSHRIVVGSVALGAVIGLVAAGRDHPCALHSDSVRADAVIATRSGHAGRGALIGTVIGGVVGVAGSTLYSVEGNRTYITIFSATEGALAGGILGGLIGWAWPTGR